jgi:hypothetical protein
LQTKATEFNGYSEARKTERLTTRVSAVRDYMTSSGACLQLPRFGADLSSFRRNASSVQIFFQCNKLLHLQYVSARLKLDYDHVQPTKSNKDLKEI